MTNPIVVSQDARLLELVQAAAAARGVVVDVVAGRDDLQAQWLAAPVALVGCDAAGLLAQAGVPPRRHVYVIGDDAAALSHWSVQLEASTVLLPEGGEVEGVGAITRLISEPLASGSGATLVRVVGGSGGVGASTLVCGMALASARAGISAAAIELDETGGGLDLIFGAEHQPGWRWPDLSSARGHLGGISQRLVRVNDVGIISQHRTLSQPPLEAQSAVIEAVARDHQVVFLDTNPESVMSNRWGALRTLLVVNADVRSVLAARATIQAHHLVAYELVIRTGAGKRLSQQEISDSLSAPVLGVLNEDKQVPKALELAELPGRSTRSRFSRDCAQLVSRLQLAPQRARGAMPSPAPARTSMFSRTRLGLGKAS